MAALKSVQIKEISMEYNKIIVSGSCGMLGSHIVKYLSGRGIAEQIIALSSNKLKAVELFDGCSDVECVSNTEFFGGEIEYNGKSVMINCAFARGDDSESLISAMNFSYELFRQISENGIGFIIHISSQGVYEQPKYGDICNEESKLAPSHIYGVAKYAQELLLKSFFFNKSIPCSILRLASLFNDRANFLEVFINNAMQGRNIVVWDGTQGISYIHIKDALKAIEALLLTSPKSWNEIYNLGSGSQISILEIAQIVKKSVANIGRNIDIEIVDKKIDQNMNLDITRIKKDTGWAPLYDMSDIVEDQIRLWLLDENNCAKEL